MPTPPEYRNGPGDFARYRAVAVLHAGRPEPEQAFTPLLALTRATETGAVGGFVIEAQRRSKNSFQCICLRLHHPDGRVLDLTFPVWGQATNARAGLAGRFGTDFSDVFRATRAAARDEAVERAVTAAFEAAWRLGVPRFVLPRACVQWSVIRTEWDEIACASRGLAVEDVRRYQRTVDVLLDRAATDFPVNLQGSIAAVLHGLSGEQAVEWFGSRAATGMSVDDAERAGTALAHGYSKAQYDSLLSRVSALMPNAAPGKVHAVATRWVQAVPGDVAAVAVAAGLKPGEAKRMLRAGRLDTDTLAAMAALHSPTLVRGH